MRSGKELRVKVLYHGESGESCHTWTFNQEDAVAVASFSITESFQGFVWVG